MIPHRIAVAISLLLASIAACAADVPPLYAMDTCTKRPYPKNDITPDEQLDLLKSLGYAGIAWTECDPAEARDVAEGCAKRGMKMYAIYCAATVGEAGVEISQRVRPIIEALKDRDAIVWLHIRAKPAPGGAPPACQSLKGDEPVVRDLRALADFAEKRRVRLVIYPHVGEWTARFADAVAVARAVDRNNFGVTFNLCHALAMGEGADIAPLLKSAGDLLSAVTLNGADAGVSGPKWKELIQPLGQGSYDVGNLLATLRDLHFTGPIAIQGYGITLDRTVLLEQSMAAWKKLATP